MSALQLPLLRGSGVTGFDLELMRAIEEAIDPATGEARSLIDLAERRAGLWLGAVSGPRERRPGHAVAWRCESMAGAEVNNGA